MKNCEPAVFGPRFAIEITAFSCRRSFFSSSVTFGVSPLDHESVDDAMEHETVVKTFLRKVDKVCDRIRGGLEVEVNDDYTLVGRNSRLDGGDARIILVKHLPFGKGKPDPAQENEDRHNRLETFHACSMFIVMDFIFVNGNIVNFFISDQAALREKR